LYSQKLNGKNITTKAIPNKLTRLIRTTHGEDGEAKVVAQHHRKF